MKDITDKEFWQIRDYVKVNLGISLSDEKKSLIYSRLRSTLQELGFENFTQYYEYLVGDKTKQALVRFIDKVTTNHTFFMREVEHFEYYRDTALPAIEETWGTGKDLRLWCAACSSGEEPYTLAMINQDYFKGKGWNTQLLATDISNEILDKAVYGVYSNESLSALPEKWKKDYLTRFDADHSSISNEIKSQVIYRKFNLMETNFRFKKKFHVIFCRNVMIYFDSDTRDQVVSKFYDMTEPGGFLFIGHSETLSHSNTQYKYIMPATYKKI